MAEPLEKQHPGADCGIPNECERVVPGWLVLLDNVPTVAMFLLGAALLRQIAPALSVLYLLYCGLSIFLFWYRICPWCHHFGTSGCPCGYGRISASLFKQRTGREFKTVFRRNIAILFPCWFLPLTAGAWLLLTQYSRPTLFLFLAFCVVGFLMIPAISRFVGCRSCTIRDECPWMSPNARGSQ